ncbi:hypothetical protein [Bradyrhizobium genosp. A]|uniref:hypothetical protein n=1 Tax=Bradyrhizobium genosp. A TaxID=83626 RepID=UPI003CF76B7D
MHDWKSELDALVAETMAFADSVAALSFRLQEPSSRFLPLAQKSASVQDNGS